MKKIISTFLVCFTFTFCFGQFVANNRQIADAFFERKDYYAAATFYKKALNISSDTTALHLPYTLNSNKAVSEKAVDEEQLLYFKLAEASRLYFNFFEAENYYEKVRDRAKFPSAQYWYGVSLIRNQKYNEAIVQLKEFLQSNRASNLIADAKAALANASFASQAVKNPSMIQINRLNGNVNQLGSNYATSVTADGMFFTSSRPISSKGDISRLVLDGRSLPVTKSANPYINTIYFVPNFRDAESSSITMVNLNRPKGMEFGAPTLSADGNTIYFTAWNSSGEPKRYSIWSSLRTANGTWSDPKSLGTSVNDGSNSKQPFVTQDGKYLIYSSDRAGGQGGFDLWFVALRTDGTTGQPINLGANVNSSKDEEAPYYNTATNRLIFSSNGRVGLGGLDLFQSFGDFAKWSIPENMGSPFNSSKHDVYFSSSNELGTEGFISSDRSSECCLEVFKFKSEVFTVNGSLSDCNSSIPLVDADVSLSFDGIEMKAKTDSEGKYSFSLVARKGFQLTFSKANYFSKTENISLQEVQRSDILLNKVLCLTPFKVEEPVVLKNIYFEFNSADLNIPSMETLDDLVKILDDNKGITIELSAHTDSVGSDEYNYELSTRRANACVQYIISKGISASRVSAKGYGESMPVAPNSVNGKDNPQGRAKNRRTEFKVLENK